MLYVPHNLSRIQHVIVSGSIVRISGPFQAAFPVFCRQAFWESYSKAANDAAHALAAKRNKEAAVRDLFKRAVSRLIPPQVGNTVQACWMSCMPSYFSMRKIRHTTSCTCLTAWNYSPRWS